jgi:hypothetical protein
MGTSKCHRAATKTGSRTQEEAPMSTTKIKVSKLDAMTQTARRAESLASVFAERGDR